MIIISYLAAHLPKLINKKCLISDQYSSKTS